MRVIAGCARGVRLAAPEGIKTRPTADRVKEALFSIITSRCAIESARVLDVCAGTGGLGIEALSRGAASCCFVENDRKVLNILERNLGAAGLKNRSDCMVSDAVKGLQMLSRRGISFDMVFFDPPYASGLYTPVLESLSSLPLLAEDALVIAESSSRSPLDDRYGALVKIDRRVYGDSALEFFVREHT